MRVPKVKTYKRPFMMQLHRRKGKSTETVETRFFARLETAISKGAYEMLFSSEPGDVIEISSSNYGYLIASVKITTKTKFGGIQFEFFHEVGLLKAK